MGHGGARTTKQKAFADGGCVNEPTREQMIAVVEKVKRILDPEEFRALQLAAVTSAIPPEQQEAAWEKRLLLLGVSSDQYH